MSTSYDVINPATEVIVKNVIHLDIAATDDVIARADKAFHTWRTIAPGERARLLRSFSHVVTEHREELAQLEITNSGHTRGNALWEADNVANTLMYYAAAPERLFGRQIPVPGGVDITFKEPLGVIGIIVPWNFPMPIAAWGFAPALAAGNTVVLKPAESTSLTALLFAEVCQQAELPAGVVNIVTGDGSTGALIVNHPGIDKIAFTGSTDVGKIIARAVASTPKSVTLELGGKAANIIFEDAALDEAVEGIVNGIFFNQGHVCCAGSRLILQESIADEVLEKLKVRMAKIRVGDPMDKNTDVGAINSKEQLTKIIELTAAGDAEGAQRWSAPCELPTKGFWFAPTIFTGVTQAHRIAREEIFGPVLSVLTFRTPQEAIDKANNTPFGLSAGVWSEKGSRILWATQQLRAGVVWANTFNKFDPTSPFGGYKESGWGREGGRHGLSAYLKGVGHE